MTSNIIDLSQDFIEDADAIATSPGSLAINDAASADPHIRTTLVLQDGKIVASYTREDVAPWEPYEVHSITKSWTSLLVGMLVDDGQLSLDMTLEDVFAGVPDAWDDVTDGTIDFRKNITLEEMLTMTSGLRYSLEDITFAATDSVESAGAGGNSIREALAQPSIGEKGAHSYVAVSNILSYAIYEVTGGMTPREYLAKNVLPLLGIDNSEIDWAQTTDGTETAFHGIEITTHQMAKFGQLYLQEGKTDDGNQEVNLISQNWVDSSFTVHAQTDFGLELGYGYLWWSVFGSTWCALGLGGQDICVQKSSGRVFVQTRDLDLADVEGGNLAVTMVGLDPTLSFEASTNSNLVNLQQCPPGLSDGVCGVDKLGDRLGFASCATECLAATCCQAEDDQPSCLGTCTEECMMYMPCLNLSAGEAPIGDTTQQCPPGLTDGICDVETLKDPSGYALCATQCSSAICCQEEDSQQSCLSVCGNECMMYIHCQNLMNVEAPLDISDQTDGDLVNEPDTTGVYGVSNEEAIELQRQTYADMWQARAAAVENGKAETLISLVQGENSVFILWEMSEESVTKLSEQFSFARKGFSIAPVSVVEGNVAKYILALNVYNSEIEGDPNGPASRYEWSTYVTDENNGGANIAYYMILDAGSNTDTLDPVDGNVAATQVTISRNTNVITFVANALSVTLNLGAESLTLDKHWLFANGRVYWENGVFDEVYFDSSLVRATPKLAIVQTIAMSEGFQLAEIISGNDPVHTFVYEDPNTYIVCPWCNMNKTNPLYDDVKLPTFGGISKLSASLIRSGQKAPTVDFTVYGNAPSLPRLHANYLIPSESVTEFVGLLKLRPGFSLAPMRFTDDESKASMYTLTLAIFHESLNFDYEPNPPRSKVVWMTYIQDDNGQVYLNELYALSSEIDFYDGDGFKQSAQIFNISHTENTIEITIQDGSIQVDAVVQKDLSIAALEGLSDEWVEAHDRVYRSNGVYDKLYYNDQLSEAKVSRLDMDQLVIVQKTPWLHLIEDEPFETFHFLGNVTFVSIPWKHIEQVSDSENVMTTEESASTPQNNLAEDDILKNSTPSSAACYATPLIAVVPIFLGLVVQQ